MSNGHLSRSLLPLAAHLALALPANAQGEVDIRHYDIEVDVREHELVETIVIHADTDRRPDTLALQLASSMSVSSIMAGDTEVPFRHSDWSLELDLSTLPADGPLPQITVTVTGKPHNQFSEARGGYLRTCVTPEIAYIRSQYAWYPRAENDLATYRVSVRTRDDWLVRTAGDESDPVTEGGRVTRVFATTAPCADIGLVAGPYISVRANVSGTFVLDALVFPEHRDHAAALLDVARRAYEFYSQRFGKVHTSRYTLVEMPAAFGKGSGYGEAGYVLIGEGAFEAGEQVPWAATLVAHEVSHTWWGQEVRFENFARESLACYSTLKFIEAEQGAKPAMRERREAVARIVDAAASGKEIGFADIRGWGSGMDPVTYRVHAYEKGMMLLAMVERAAGERAIQRALSRLFEQQRGKTIGYQTLRAALAKCGKKSRTVLDQWEDPGIPDLSLNYDTKKSGNRFKVTGTLSQAGASGPFRMEVPLVAICGDSRIETIVKLTGAQKTFTLTTPAEPDSIAVDPDYHLLVGRPRVSPVDPKQVIQAAFNVVNSPAQNDSAKLEDTIAMLSGLLDGDPGKFEGLCHTGIGRCKFRLGAFDDARASFEQALMLGAGGPFHRAWIHLRLGNMADVEQDRAQAQRHYEKAIAQGERYLAAKRAAEYLTRAYRGYDVER